MPAGGRRGSSTVTVAPGARRNLPVRDHTVAGLDAVAEVGRLADDALDGHGARRNLVVRPDHPGDHALLRRQDALSPAPAIMLG